MMLIIHVYLISKIKYINRREDISYLRELSYE